MATITDIKRKIMELAPGPFQEFCDTLIAKQGYGSVLGFGMKTGTGKTTIGNPDTYFRKENGKYAFVAYTTQETSIYSKLKEDIKKCLDPTKTGIETDNIEEIICCHTSSNLSAGDDKKLHDYCEEKGVVLSIWGLDEIANQVHNRYRSLAKDYLGLCIDTNQILSLDEFIEQSDANGMSAPLSTDFQYREKEKEEIINALAQEDVVIVTGKAGVGKTRLAIEAVQEIALLNEYKLLCVKNNNLGLYEDLVSVTEESGRYLFFVDDANELADLSQILAYTAKGYRGYKVKIVATVRDYAKAKVISSVREHVNPRIIEIPPLSDDEIKGFLNVNLNIHNNDYIKQIIRIAEGNPRVAYMAGKLAVEKQNISSIRDVSQLYEFYYEKYIDGTIGKDKDLCFAAGILSIVNAVLLNNLSPLQELLEDYGITCDDFKNKVLELASLEVVEVQKEQVATLSDQCLSNYMLYYVFFQIKLIPFSCVLEIGYEHFRNGVLRSIDTIFNIFDSEETRAYCEQEVYKVWDSYKNNNRCYEDFVKDFHVFRPEEAFLLAKQKIENVEQRAFDASIVDFNRNVFCQDESILTFLRDYHNSTFLCYVFELLISYASKTEETLISGYRWLENNYGIGVNDYKYGYYSQRVISEYILGAVSNGDAIAYAIGSQWTKYALGFSFTPTEIGRGNKLILYNLKLKSTEGVKEFRLNCWDILFELASKDSWQDKVVLVLDNYSRNLSSDPDREIVINEVNHVCRALEAIKSSHVSYLKIVERLITNYSKLGVEIDEKWVGMLCGSEWELYKLLEDDFLSSGLEYEEYVSQREGRIRKYGENLAVDEIPSFIQCVNNILSDSMNNHDSYEINHGVEIIIQEFDITRMEAFLKAYVELKPQLSINPSVVMKKLNESCDSKALLSFINNTTFPQKNEWQFSYFNTLPEEKVDDEMLDAFIRFLRSDADKDLISISFRRLRVLDKFRSVKSDIYPVACSIIFEKRHYSDLIVRSYFEHLFHDRIYSPKELYLLFKNDISLLQDIYYYMIRNDDLTDFTGTFLISFLSLGEIWLKRFSEVFWEHVINHKGYHIYKIKSLWKSEHYIKYFNYIFYNCPTERIYGWTVSSAFKEILSPLGDDVVVAEHKQEWLKHIIVENACSDNIYIVFEIVCELEDDMRRGAIKTFLDNNSDYEVFKKLTITPNHWFGTGSLVPAYQKQIEFLESLLPLVPGVKFLKHKTKIKEDVEMLQEMIKREEIEEICRNLYM